MKEPKQTPFVKYKTISYPTAISFWYIGIINGKQLTDLLKKGITP